MKLAVSKAWQWRIRLVSQQETSRLDKLCATDGFNSAESAFLGECICQEKFRLLSCRRHSENSAWEANPCLQTPDSLFFPVAQFYLSLPGILAGTDFRAVSVVSYLPLEQAAGTNQILKKIRSFSFVVT